MEAQSPATAHGSQQHLFVKSPIEYNMVPELYIMPAVGEFLSVVKTTAAEKRIYIYIISLSLGGIIETKELQFRYNHLVFKRKKLFFSF